MNKLRLRPRLAALLTTSIVCLCLLALSSASAWAKVGAIKEFPIPTTSSVPVGITVGPDGNLWFTESNARKIGRITTKGRITEFPLPRSYRSRLSTSRPGRMATSGSLSSRRLMHLCPSVIVNFGIKRADSEEI